MRSKIVVIICILSIFVTSIFANDLFINEFMASNDFAYPDPNGEYDDWIEIYNAGTEPVDIGGMYITDDLTSLTEWQIPTTAPDSTTIQPGDFLVLWADKQSEQGVLHVEIKLSGGGEQIGLTESDTLTVVDSLTYTDQTTDISYGRYPDGEDDWTFMPEFTPGEPNNEGIIILPVFINEFMADSSTEEDWLEIYNDGDEVVDIGGMYLTDNFSYPTEIYQFPTGEGWTQIASHDYLVLILDEDNYGEITLNENGEQIGLVDGSGLTFIDSVSFGQQTEDTSYSRFNDASVVWTFCSEPTQDAANVPTTTGEALFINEFMASNDTTIEDEYGEFDDWLELYNDTGSQLDLAGMYLSDGGDPWRFPVDVPDSTTIDDFILIWCDDQDEQGALHATFKLSGSGETIILLDSDGHSVIDFYEYDDQTTDVSFGRYPDGTDVWQFMTPTPEAPNVQNSVEDNFSISPNSLTLLGNYPNPFNPETIISFQTKKTGNVQLKIYNIKGRLVYESGPEKFPQGKHEIMWNGKTNDQKSLASGMYFYKISTAQSSKVSKMLLLK